MCYYTNPHSQGWQVSPIYGTNHGFYPISPEILSPMGEMAESRETNFVENLNENTKLILYIISM